MEYPQDMFFLFSIDWIQFMCLWQEYHGSDVGFLSLYPIMTSICPIIDEVIITHLVILDYLIREVSASLSLLINLCN